MQLNSGRFSNDGGEKIPLTHPGTERFQRAPALESEALFMVLGNCYNNSNWNVTENLFTYRALPCED